VGLMVLYLFSCLHNDNVSACPMEFDLDFTSMLVERMKVLENHQKFEVEFCDSSHSANSKTR